MKRLVEIVSAFARVADYTSRAVDSNTRVETFVEYVRRVASRCFANSRRRPDGQRNNNDENRGDFEIYNKHLSYKIVCPFFKTCQASFFF